MAKVKTLYIRRVDHNTRQTLIECNVDIKVTSKGLFKAELPENIYKELSQINMLPDGYQYDGFISANTLYEIEQLIYKSIEPLATYTEIENKIVIKYSISTACMYVKTTDGQYMPYAKRGHEYECDSNGQAIFFDGSERRDGSCGRGPYHLSVICYIRRKITNQFKDGQKKTYYKHVDEEELGENGAWLRGLIGIGTSYSYTSNEDKLSEIDYTESNALFFKQFITGIFKINDLVKNLNNEKMLSAFLSHHKELPFNN